MVASLISRLLYLLATAIAETFCHAFFSLATENNLAKRCRLSSYSQAVDQLSTGMLKADSKGCANKPGPSIQSSSTQHGRTPGMKTRSAAKRNVQAARVS